MKIIIETPTIKELKHKTRQQRILHFEEGANVSIRNNKDELMEQVKVAPDLPNLVMLGDDMIILKQQGGWTKLAMVLFGVGLGSLFTTFFLSLAGCL